MNFHFPIKPEEFVLSPLPPGYQLLWSFYPVVVCAIPSTTIPRPGTSELTGSISSDSRSVSFTTPYTPTPFPSWYPYTPVPKQVGAGIITGYACVHYRRICIWRQSIHPLPAKPTALLVFAADGVAAVRLVTEKSLSGKRYCCCRYTEGWCPAGCLLSSCCR